MLICLLRLGDALNPSLMSTYTKGRHMVPFLNLLKVHTACLGNHDFDFGIDELEYTVGSCNFPWLLTNVLEKSTSDQQRKIDNYLQAADDRACREQCAGEHSEQSLHCLDGVFDHASSHDSCDDAYVGLPGEPLANALKYRLFEWQGIRFGVIGLVERGKAQN